MLIRIAAARPSLKISHSPHDYSIIPLMPDEDREEGEYRPRWNELITLAEASKLSGLSTGHLRLLAGQGEIWARRLGHNWFTTEQAIREYLARDRRPGPKSQDDS
jgi:hypothetical protein